MTWTKFTAPSDLDYWQQGRRTGIQRTCVDCGDPVMVDRDEAYQVQIFCDDCRQRGERRQAIKAAIASRERKGVA